VSARDRTVTIILVGAAVAAWLLVALVFTTVSPERDAGAQLLGALTLGAAVALTVWPLLWSASRSAPGAMITSGRRSGLAGLVVVILIVLRAIDVVTLPVLLFLIVGAVLVEVAFSLRR
jgi:membrane protease YdiL (CAAX protease family)